MLHTREPSPQPRPLVSAESPAPLQPLPRTSLLWGLLSQVVLTLPRALVRDRQLAFAFPSSQGLSVCPFLPLA